MAHTSHVPAQHSGSDSSEGQSCVQGGTAEEFAERIGRLEDAIEQAREAGISVSRVKKLLKDMQAQAAAGAAAAHLQAVLASRPCGSGYLKVSSRSLACTHQRSALRTIAYRWTSLRYIFTRCFGLLAGVCHPLCNTCSQLGRATTRAFGHSGPKHTAPVASNIWLGRQLRSVAARFQPLPTCLLCMRLQAEIMKAEAVAAAAAGSSILWEAAQALQPAIADGKRQQEVEKAGEVLARAVAASKGLADLPKLEAAIVAARKAGAHEADVSTYR